MSLSNNNIKLYLPFIGKDNTSPQIKDYSNSNHSITFNRLFVICKNNILKLYLNNVLVEELHTFAYTNPSTDSYIGGNGVGSEVGSLKGQLQELIILDCAVDESYIEKDWNDGNGRFYPI